MKKIVEKPFFRYIFVFALIAIIVVFSTVGFFMMYTKNQDEDAMSFFNEIGLQSSRIVENKLNTYIEFLHLYASDLEDYKTNTDDINLEILSRLANYSVFHDVMLADGQGNAISVKYGNANIGRRQYHKESLNGNDYVSETIISDYTGEQVNVYSVPIRKDGIVIGVLAGAMENLQLSETLRDACYQEEGTNFIISSDGVILVSPTNDYLYAKMGANIFDKAKMLESDSARMRNSLSERNAQGTMVFEIDGQKYYAAYNAIAYSDWIVLTFLPDTILKSITFNTMAGVSVFVVTFSASILVLLVLLLLHVKSHMSKISFYQNENSFLKNVDPLTGFNTYGKFLELVEEMFKISDNSQKYAMVALDINKFRAINDLLGHESGNSILIQLSTVINRNINDDEVFARMASDSFVILVKYQNDNEIIEEIENIITDTSYQITEFLVVLAIGIYKITDKNMDLRSIIDRADLARRTVKNSNESNYAFFDSNMLSKIREEKAIENVMEQALESNEFKVYLQPKFDMNNRTKIIGAEALVRWLKEGQIIPPAAFIPLFEKNGFITKLDRFVFEEVCKQQKVWLSKGYEMRTISVNMSRTNMQEPHFVKDLYDICLKYNMPTKYFEIEITESVGFENINVLLKVFEEIKSYGFSISIDDFGTGYSSLNMLKDLPVDVLKIDRAFLDDTNTNDRAKQIISHVIALAVTLKMETICEGIETLEQVEMLSSLGCNMAQGYYFARPMPISEYEKLIYSSK